MQKTGVVIAAISLLVFIAGISKMVQLSDSWTYFSGFVGFLILSIQAVSSRLKSDGKSR